MIFAYKNSRSRIAYHDWMSTVESQKYISSGQIIFWNQICTEFAKLSMKEFFSWNNSHRFWESLSWIKIIQFKKVRFKSKKAKVWTLPHFFIIIFKLFSRMTTSEQHIDWCLESQQYKKNTKKTKKINRHGVTFKLYSKSKVSNCFVVNQIFVQANKILTTLLKEKRKINIVNKKISLTQISLKFRVATIRVAN